MTPAPAPPEPELCTQHSDLQEILLLSQFQKVGIVFVQIIKPKVQIQNKSLVSSLNIWLTRQKVLSRKRGELKSIKVD